MLIRFPYIFLYYLSIDREQVVVIQPSCTIERRKNPSFVSLFRECLQKMSCSILAFYSFSTTCCLSSYRVESKEKDKYVMKHTSTNGLLIHYFLTRTYHIIYIYIYCLLNIDEYKICLVSIHRFFSESMNIVLSLAYRSSVDTAAAAATTTTTAVTAVI
jgi:hypothetical protein